MASRRTTSAFDGAAADGAKLLQAAGYQTAMIGKWHLGSDPTGFDYWHILQGQGPYYNPPMKTPTGVVKHDRLHHRHHHRLTLDWLKKKRDKDKPFFLMYQHKAPHRNWQPGPKHLDNYKDVKIPEPETLFDDYSGRGTPPQRSGDDRRASTCHRDDLKLTPPSGLNPEQLGSVRESLCRGERSVREAKLDRRRTQSAGSISAT